MKCWIEVPESVEFDPKKHATVVPGPLAQELLVYLQQRPYVESAPLIMRLVKCSIVEPTER